ncbi:MAG: indolepyruvate ferredoxin oxidoreductase subunit alpha [Desulfomonilia bacterium]
MSWRPKWWLTFLATIWPITGASAKATQIPVIGNVFTKMVIPLFSGKNFNVSYLPINEELASPESVTLPLIVLEEIIRRSAHRVILNRCHCRDSEGCTKYPIENACLLLGQGTMEIKPWIATPVSVDEAVDHARYMVGLGLTPMVGRVLMDNLFYGVPNTGKLLTVCFCCHCCCTVMASAKYFPQKAKDAIVRLKGMKIAVDLEKCKDCTTRECVDECIVKAFAVQDGRVIHDPDKCKGCGWCVAICPHKAVTIEVEDIDAAVDEFLGRIGSLVNYS